MVAVICSENLHAKIVDDSTAVKTCITGDATRVEPKGQPAYTVKKHFIVIQATNEFPRTRDDTGSFIRRWVVLPYHANFNGGKDLKAVKSTLIVCRETLEYAVSKVVAHMLTNGPSVRFIQPSSGLAALNEMREVNDPVLSFASEVLDKIASPAVPVKFVYDVYIAWLKATNPSASPMSMRRFNARLKEHITGLNLPWESGIKRPQAYPEPVIQEFRMADYFHSGRTAVARITPVHPATAVCWFKR
jgi:phage/plasmid-associated DNA primase